MIRLVRCYLLIASFTSGVLSELLAESPPQPATVVKEIADVRSGPGDDFYATSRLKHGSSVEVYRTEDNGWCAIRPPADSFSWVPLDAVEVEADGQHARVLRDDAFTYVGSQFSDAHHVEYIPLEPAEKLRILGSRVLAEPAGGEQREWIKVAPPDGEFRWIHREDLQIGSGPVPAPQAAASPAHEESATARTALPVAPATTSKPAESAEDSELYVSDDQWRPKGSAAAAPPAETPTATAPAATDATATAATDEPPQTLTPAQQAAAPLTAQATTADEDVVPTASLSPESDLSTAIDPTLGWHEKLEQIDLKLSTIVAEPVESWKLQPLRQLLDETRQEIGDDAVGQADADSLGRRIAQFERVHERFVKLAADAEQGTSGVTLAPHAQPRLLSGVKARPLPTGMATDSQLVPTSVQVPEAAVGQRPRPLADVVGAGLAELPAPPSVAADAQPDRTAFDGEGLLMPVFTSRSDVPEFALTDDQGRIVQFVSADEALNLRRYLRKRVGIYGTRGFLPSFQKAHITATRVVVLEP